MDSHSTMPGIAPWQMGGSDLSHHMMMGLGGGGGGNFLDSDLLGEGDIGMNDERQLEIQVFSVD